ncbi:DUF3772 domain-containing protein [Xylophilus sp. GOD-11R]|uniref:DUF3772 domain-containing protein n=1 Tax=Xylophilus sp. GOD-11R TaxID=3089814 RepID=UPI00298CCDFA|nr:DUF3772 domain-containing protein [Xylophilus sp. GOD-11R]WPB59323.1 DUF3772 domain-containing protein [Xylophilus sp. GOD-11R]
MSSPNLLRRLCSLLVLSLASLVAAAATSDETAATAASLDTARDSLTVVQKQLGSDTTIPDTTLAKLRTSALDIQVVAEQAQTALEPALSKVTARQAELGTPTAGVTEAPDVAQQRAALEKERAALDAQVKLARLLSVESAQAADTAADLRRSQFNAQIGERTSSMLAAPFWQELRSGTPRDAVRVRTIARDVGATASATPWLVWVGLAVAAVAVFFLQQWAGRKILRVASQRVPPGRLRRSLLALLRALLAIVVPGLIAHFLRLGITWGAKPDEALDSLLARTVGTVCFAAFVQGLGKALLAAKKPSWRLPPLSDAMALALRRHPLVLAIVIVLGWELEQLTVLANGALATTVALESIYTLTLGLVVLSALLRVRRVRRAEKAESDAAPPADTPGEPVKPGQHLARLPWTTVALGALGAVLLVSVVCLLLGYVALGSFLVKQIVWIGVVAATAYLLVALLDDFFMAVSAPAGGATAAMAEDGGLRVRAQAGVLLSAISRLAVLLFALVLVVAPFGQGPDELLQRAGQLRDGLAIGELKLQPGAVLQAIVVFVLATIGVRLLQRWLRDRYLPTTGLDAAMRDSAISLMGFVGIIAALAFALSAIGLGLERIAWVASALSVGIGFGLQAVVSNFVSGLILLAERPVKVGDWVSLSGVEGDIRRINVRATEIQMGDRSTVIVPNSEFITKIVRNVTLANPLGQVSFKLPMALDTDVVKVRDIILQVFESNEGVLAEPAPKVFLESVENERLIFAANGAVASPRQSYAVKSALLFETLARLRAIGQFPVKASEPPPAAPPETGVVAPALTAPASGVALPPQAG